MFFPVRDDGSLIRLAAGRGEGEDDTEGDIFFRDIFPEDDVPRIDRYGRYRDTYKLRGIDDTATADGEDEVG